MGADAGLGLMPPRPRRRVGLTPMIDVVFLILVFFMLAARFGLETQMPLVLASGGQAEAGPPPRVLDLARQGLQLDGIARSRDEALALLAAEEGAVVLRPGEGVDVGMLVGLLDTLRAAGIGPVSVME